MVLSLYKSCSKILKQPILALVVILSPLNAELPQGFSDYLCGKTDQKEENVWNEVHEIFSNPKEIYDLCCEVLNIEGINSERVKDFLDEIFSNYVSMPITNIQQKSFDDLLKRNKVNLNKNNSFFKENMQSILWFQCGIFGENVPLDFKKLGYLIDNKCIDINGQFFLPQYSTLLCYAIFNGAKEMVQFLISKEVDVNLRTGEYSLSPLAYAIRCSSDLDIIEMLIKAGADINIMDQIKNFKFYHVKNVMKENQIESVDYVPFNDEELENCIKSKVECYLKELKSLQETQDEELKEKIRDFLSSVEKTEQGWLEVSQEKEEQKIVDSEEKIVTNGEKQRKLEHIMKGDNNVKNLADWFNRDGMFFNQKNHVLKMLYQTSLVMLLTLLLTTLIRKPKLIRKE